MLLELGAGGGSGEVEGPQIPYMFAEQTTMINITNRNMPFVFIALVVSLSYKKVVFFML